MVRAYNTASNLFVRIAVFWFFIVEGTYNGVLSAYLPQIQERLGISDGMLGAAMLLNYLGQMLATPGAGQTMRKKGSRVATFSGGFAFVICIPFVAMDTSYTAFCAILLYFGLTQGFMDCSMNSCGILTEVVAKYPILGSFHGGYSIAAAVGAFVGNAMYAAHWSDLIVCTVLAAVSSALTLLAGYTLYDMREEKEILDMASQETEVATQVEKAAARAIEDSFSASSSQHEIAHKQLLTREDSLDRFNGYDQSFNTNSTVGSGMSGTQGSTDNLPLLEIVKNEEGKGKYRWLTTLFMMPQTMPLFYLSLLGYLASFTESGLTTFVIIFYLRYFPAAPTSSATIGFVCFQVFMGCGRLLVDKLRRWLGSRNVCKIGGMMATTGLALLVWSPSLTPTSGSTATTADMLMASFGMSICGFGLSTLIPLSYACAGYIEHSGTSIATVSCWMYSGGILSSPIIGIISSGFDSLRIGMAFVAMCAFCVIPLGFFIPTDRYTQLAVLERDDDSVVLDDDMNAPLIV
jgi:hypothetical protein